MLFNSSFFFHWVLSEAFLDCWMESALCLIVVTLSAAISPEHIHWLFIIIIIILIIDTIMYEKSWFISSLVLYLH